MSEINETGRRGIWSRVRTKKGMLVISLAALLCVVGVAAATTVLFTQTASTQTVNTGADATDNCAVLVMETVTTGSVDTNFLFDCGSSTAAFRDAQFD